MLVFWEKNTGSQVDLPMKDAPAGCRALCKWLQPPLRVLCCSLNYLSAHGKGGNGVVLFSHPCSGKFIPATLQEALTEK